MVITCQTAVVRYCQRLEPELSHYLIAVFCWLWPWELCWLWWWPILEKTLVKGNSFFPFHLWHHRTTVVRNRKREKYKSPCIHLVCPLSYNSHFAFKNETLFSHMHLEARFFLTISVLCTCQRRSLFVTIYFLSIQKILSENSLDVFHFYNHQY